MLESYKKLVQLEKDMELKPENYTKELEEIKKIIYQKKDFILDKLITYLKKELNIDYFNYQIKDLDGNIADILVKKDSIIFKNNIDKKEFLNFTTEELIDNRVFDNKDEIIIVDNGFNDSLLDIGYICKTLDYTFLSYTEEVKQKLVVFLDYIINNKIYKR